MPNRRQSDLDFCFKENALSVFQNGKEVRRITAWPTPFAEKVIAYGTRLSICPTFRFISKPLRASKRKPDNQLEFGLDIDTSPNTGKCSKQEAYDQLRQTIPDKYSTPLAAFYCDQWNPLRFLSINGDFLELIISNPPLAYFLANDPAISDRVFYELLNIDDLIRMPQTDLMKMLRLPDTNKTVKLMRKLAPESASPETLALFKTILKSNQLASNIAHVQRINTGILHLLNLKPKILEALTPKFLAEIENDPKSLFSRQVATLFKETVTIYNRLHGRRQPLRIRSLEQLQELHTEMLTWHTEQSDDKQCGTFPPPPIPGNRRIVPLKTDKALWTEGKFQHICVGSRRYAEAVRAGEKYIYLVKEPQRATLSIEKGAGGTWIISELFTACNKRVKDETRAAVEDWLSNAQIGI